MLMKLCVCFGICLSSKWFHLTLTFFLFSNFGLIIAQQTSTHMARAILSQKCILSRTERYTCTPVFITALFTVARTWKQPRCLSADEWMRKLRYIYTMEYYSAIKKNAFESVLMRWMKLEPIIHSEVSQKEKHQYSIIIHIYGI